MNCVGGDYLETLLYKVLVALDAHTPVAELAKSILQVDLQLVKVLITAVILRRLTRFCTVGRLCLEIGLFHLLRHEYASHIRVQLSYK